MKYNMRCQNEFCGQIYSTSSKKSKFCCAACKKVYYNSYNDSLSLEQKKKILKERIDSCQMCGNTDKDLFEVDHILPTFKGGGDNFDNLRVLCSNCHTKRHKLDEM